MAHYNSCIISCAHVGTNDDEDFPETFLLEIFDRIQQKQFETGKDHTHQVLEIRKKITGHGIPVSHH